MRTVRGIYDGERVRLLEPVAIEPDTEVEVVVPDQQPPAAAGELDSATEDEREQAFLQQLVELGIIEKINPLVDDEEPFTPIPNPGEPISDTIIRGRR